MKKIRRYVISSLILCLSILMTACQSSKGAAASVSQSETGQSRAESTKSRAESGESQGGKSSESRTESSESRTESSESRTKSSESRTESSESRAESTKSRAESGESQSGKPDESRTKPGENHVEPASDAIPGTYTVPEGWVKSDQYSTSRKVFYVKAGHEKDKKPDNISINVGKNHYSLDQQDEFREAIVNQLLAQLKGTDSELKGSGTYTKQGYLLYTFIIKDPVAETRQYYILDDKRFCLIHLTNYTGDKDDNEAAQAMTDSFVWTSPRGTE